MPTPTMHGPGIAPTLRPATVVHPRVLRGDLLGAAGSALRPLVVSIAVITAAATGAAPAQADPPGDSSTNVLTSVGIGNNGPLSTAVAGIGQSICPMLVQPGATFASVASQLAGNTGLSPAIAGFVTGMAIQMECPGVMTSLANGDAPFPLQLAGGSPAPPIAFQPPGTNPMMPGATGAGGGAWRP
ncbi:DUF732 domain-containing protein [Mycobacterium sp. pUA109]|uniref:DUF732 domain-containing protein n=1 Tax=Mycobacterium sp. pUA109 TaxID=3238982 RepID=UPI00351BE44D